MVGSYSPGLSEHGILHRAVASHKSKMHPTRSLSTMQYAMCHFLSQLLFALCTCTCLCARAVDSRGDVVTYTEAGMCGYLWWQVRGVQDERPAPHPDA